MSNYVFIIDTNKKPCNPVHPGTARQLLKFGKAAVFRRFPFTLILKAESTEPVREIQLKIDPGSKTTGIALTQGTYVIWGSELTHRGQAIKASLESRKSLRRGRRARHTRYRSARFLNRSRRQGWLTPSLQHRVETTDTWVNKLTQFAPLSGISQELVRFDLQQIENPEISGIEYQQGELQGYEVREYLLEKWDRKCSYCDVKDVPLQIEHIQPKAKGGTNKISNLCLACDACNKKKGTQDIEKFLAKKPEVLKKIKSQAKRPLKDAAAVKCAGKIESSGNVHVNSTRWALLNRLKETGLRKSCHRGESPWQSLPVVTGSGGKTKFNRTRLELPKTHWIDAACVGDVETLKLLTTKPLLIKATGHGTRQICRTDKFGFPNRHCSRTKFHFGFQTGDIVKAVVKVGKKIGTHIGRIATRATGSFNISTTNGLVQGISHKYCKAIHRKDGYGYSI
jgi:5-methylcytosine-specific restriction endonuclease McrA